MTYKQYTIAGLILLVVLGAFLFAQSKSSRQNDTQNESAEHKDNPVAPY